MKVNEAPKKLYLLSNGLISYCRNTDEDVEYTSTDALIEKARIYIANHFLAPGMDNEINDFVNYMKGEQV